MTQNGNRKNFLILEGRSLASGEQGQLTAEEWLYSYDEIKDDLKGAQANVFAGLEQRIRDRIVERAMNAVAL